MNMSKEAVETLGMTLAQTTLFLANCNGRVRVCMRISAMHLVHPFAFWKHGVPSRHTHEKGVPSHQQSSADPACIQANISPPFNRYAVCLCTHMDMPAVCNYTVNPGRSLPSVFSTTSSTSFSCMNFTLMPSLEPLDGPSAMLLKEGTLAYQALTPEESSRARR